MAEAPAPAAAEVVVAGHICLDVIPALAAGGAAFAPGQTVEAGPAVLATGGAVSNTGLALHRLGVATRLVGKVGDDLFGQAIRQIVERHGAGLAGDMVVAPGESTSYSIILSPPGADRMLLHAPGCNATFRAADVPDAALADARLFHFGYPPLMESMWRDGGAELVALFRRAKALGLTTALDLAMPAPESATARADWRAILAATLPRVDVFLPSLSELLLLLKRPTFDQLASDVEGGNLLDRVPATLVSDLGARILALGAKVVGLKLGHRGLYLRTADERALAAMGRASPARPMPLGDWANRELWTPCYATTMVGTTGAGDTTIAGFLMGLLRGLGAEHALAAACAVGACSVEAPDAIGGVRSWRDTAARIAAGWPLLPLAVEEPGWHWDDHRALLVGPADRNAH